MNIFKRELRANLKSLLIWCAAQFFIIYAGMVKYGGFSGSAVDIEKMMEQFPKALLAVFGMGTVDMSKVDGFYSIFFIFFLLLAGIHASMLGVVLIAKEERDHAADFLYSKPVSRKRVITAKLAAGLFNILMFNLLTFVASIYCISLYNDGNPLAGKVAFLMSALLIFQVLFLCLGAAFGALLKTARKASALMTGVLLGMFFLSAAIDIDERINFLKYLTPFKYFEAQSLLFGGSLPWSSLIICAVLTALALAVTYRLFGRRDLST